MALTEKDHQLLWRYIDGECSKTEEVQIQEHIEQAEPWREELQQKLLLHEVMKGMEPQHTSMRFVKTSWRICQIFEPHLL